MIKELTKKQSIVFDARHLKSGIGTYIRALLGEFGKMDLPFSLTLIGDPETLRSICPTAETIKYTAPIYSLSEQVMMPILARGASILHVPHFNVPLLYRGRMVVTIFDVAHLALPTIYRSPFRRLFSRLLYRTAARRAERVFTISEFSKSEIVKFTGIDKKKIEVTPCGFDRQLFANLNEVEVDARCRELAVSTPYLLYVGNLKPHKNMENLINGFVLAKEKHGIPHTLLLVGKADPKYAANLPVNDHVKYLPDCSNRDVALLMAGADALLHLSLYEGFGLPPLEAMAAGTPVIVSDIPVLHEVVGDAGLFCNPHDVNEIADAIFKLTSNHGLLQQLRTLGCTRAQHFSWRTTAERTLAVYESLL